MNVSTPTQIGAAIKDRRRQLRMTQDELARRVGTTRRWVSAVENGSAGAGLGLVLKTLEALDLIVALNDGTTKPTHTVPEPPDIDTILHRAKGRTS